MSTKPSGHGKRKWRPGGLLERHGNKRHGRQNSMVHLLAVRKNRKQFLILCCVGAAVFVVFTVTVLLELLAIEDDGVVRGSSSSHNSAGFVAPAGLGEPSSSSSSSVVRDAFQLMADGDDGSIIAAGSLVNFRLSADASGAINTRIRATATATATGTAMAPPPPNWWLLDFGAPVDLDPAVAGWKPVLGSLYKFFVYSAFYESRPMHPFVRVVGATKTKLPGKAWCRLFYDDANGWPSQQQEHAANNDDGPYSSLVPPGQIVTQGRIKIIRENWNLLYSAAFILCPLPTTGPLASEVPSAVAIMKTSDAEDLGNKIKIDRIDRDGKPGHYPSSGLGVCVKPFYGNYKKVLQLMEFVETNAVFGVNWFTFYNHSLSSEARCLLDHYVEQGLAEVLPWNFPFTSGKEIRTEGIFASLNDCVYRNMPRSRYLALVDMDELIVPHQTTDLLTTLAMVDDAGSSLKNKHSPHHQQQQQHGSSSAGLPTLQKGSFSFQNAFFYLDWPDDLSDFPEAWPLATLRKTRRKTKLNPHRQRSKYIVVAKNVIEVGNHFVWEHVKGHGAATVPPEVAMLHHYRQCEFGDDCTSLPSSVDRTAWKFLPRVFERFRETLREVSVKCGIDNRTLSESPRY